tara:strand:- start:2153 stop:2479 length:327 start_codon:yes stop_codon:yes gene_type:complete
MKKLLSILFIFLSLTSFGQVTVAYYNAEWNKANSVEWINKLKDCDITKVDIVKQPKLQQKHQIVVVPTIIIFLDGEEVKRYQADVSFTMKATREEVQEKIEEIIMDNF